MAPTQPSPKDVRPPAIALCRKTENWNKKKEKKIKRQEHYLIFALPRPRPRPRPSPAYNSGVLAQPLGGRPMSPVGGGLTCPLPISLRPTNRWFRPKCLANNLVGDRISPWPFAIRTVVFSYDRIRSFTDVRFAHYQPGRCVRLSVHLSQTTGQNSILFGCKSIFSAVLILTSLIVFNWPFEGWLIFYLTLA